jgi:threonine dehydrogenase-like Zn-dependent dehydrogenase
MHAFDRIAPVTAETTVLVQGCGAVGLFATAVARDRGAGSVLVIGDPPTRHDLARRLGASHTCGLDLDVAERRAWVLDATRGIGPDVVIECATAAAIREGLDLLRPGGDFLCIGGGGSAPPVSPDVFAKTLTLTSIRGGEGRHYRGAIEYLATRPIEPFLELLGEPFALARTGDALVAMANLEQIKPVINPA